MMMPKMFQDMANEVRPHLVSAGDRACGYAERIISRLDAIHEAVYEEEYEELRRRENLVIVAGAQQKVATVPPGESWVLEAVTARVSAVTLLAVVVDERTVWVKNFATHDSHAGNGVLLPSNTTIRVDNIGAGDATSVYVQFKRQTVRLKGRRTVAAPPAPTPDSPNRPLTARHAPSLAA